MFVVDVLAPTLCCCDIVAVVLVVVVNVLSSSFQWVCRCPSLLLRDKENKDKKNWNNDKTESNLKDEPIRHFFVRARDCVCVCVFARVAHRIAQSENATSPCEYICILLTSLMPFDVDGVTAEQHTHTPKFNKKTSFRIILIARALGYAKEWHTMQMQNIYSVHTQCSCTRMEPFNYTDAIIMEMACGKVINIQLVDSISIYLRLPFHRSLSVRHTIQHKTRSPFPRLAFGLRTTIKW